MKGLRWDAWCLKVRCIPAMVVLGCLPLTGNGLPVHPGSSADAPFSRLTGPGGEGTAILNVQTGETFPSIQDAVDDADTLNGHTLRVQVANHPEGQVLINKNLTLEGATGTEIVAMSVDTGNMGDNRAWFLVDTGIDLQVRNLTFDGNGRLVHQGFRHKGTGRFENCTFRDIQFNPSGPDYAGIAIVAFGGTVDVANCVFEDIGRVGILAFGAVVSGALFENITYTGKGNGDFLDYAFDISAGAVVTVRGADLRQCRGVASVDGSISGGILISTFFGPGTAGTLTSNTIVDNSNGVLAGTSGDSSAVAMAFNRIAGNDTGMVSNTPGIQAENNWWGCNGGPNTPGCDAIASPANADFDPWLTLSLAAMPTTVLINNDAMLTASLTLNSDGIDTIGMGHLPNGTQLTFGAVLGTVATPVVGTTSGLALTVFTAGGSVGAGEASVMLDNQSVAVPLEIIAVTVPALGPAGLVMLLVLLGLTGVWLVRKRV